MNNSQKIDVYAGTNLNVNKKNSKVLGDVIIDSGVANYILVVDKYNEDINYYLSKLFKIEEFAVQQDIYFACKAVNYRAQVDKWDGNRPLAVFVNCSIEHRFVKAEIIFDKPLEIKANEIGNRIRTTLKELKINHTNFEELRKYLDPSIKVIG